ncbi:hypothetical protein DFJ73DRAFT_319200 [Zopfochytrium polystomum]|nr:hypothetical protein DFJ73DRAFT_319200 [Zopfochytrium polystomum]
MAHSTLKRIVRVFESSLSSVGFGDGDGFAALGPNRGAVQMRRGGDGRSSSSGLFANGGEGENGDDEDDDDEDDEDDEERLVVKCVELRDELDALAISLEHTPVPNARWRHEPFLDDWVEATPVPPVGRMQRGAEAIRLQRAQPLPLDDETEDDLGFGLSSHPWAARAGRLSRHGGDDDQTGVAQTPLQRRYLPHPSRRARPSEKEEKKEKDDKGFALSDCSSAATTRHNIGCARSIFSKSPQRHGKRHHG